MNYLFVFVRTLYKVYRLFNFYELSMHNVGNWIFSCSLKPNFMKCLTARKRDLEESKVHKHFSDHSGSDRGRDMMELFAVKGSQYLVRGFRRVGNI